MSAPASTLTPSVSSSPSATVYEHTSFFASSPVLPLWAQVAVLSAAPTMSASVIVLVASALTVSSSLKVTSTLMTSAAR